MTIDICYDCQSPVTEPSTGEIVDTLFCTDISDNCDCDCHKKIEDPKYTAEQQEILDELRAGDIMEQEAMKEYPNYTEDDYFD